MKNWEDSLMDMKKVLYFNKTYQLGIFLKKKVSSGTMGCEEKYLSEDIIS